MKIWLLQRNEPTPHDNDGNKRLFRTGIMAQMLSEHGHEVVWWTSNFDHYNRCHRFKGNIRKVVKGKYHVHYLQSRGYSRNISLDRVAANKEVASSFAKEAVNDPNVPDLIIASIPTAELAWQAIKYAKSHNIPVILDVRDLWPDHIVSVAPIWLIPFARLVTLPLSRLTSKVFAQATGIFGLTDSFIEWGLNYAGRERNCYDRVVPMGYIKNSISESHLNEESQFWDTLGVKDDGDYLIVTFIGNIGRSFDLNVILDAAQLLQVRGKRVKFVICGDGELATALSARAVDLENVVMPGWINKNQIKTLLMRSDVGLLPYVNAENFIKNVPNKPGEYLSEGLFLLSSLSKGVLFEFIKKYDCGISYENNALDLTDKLCFYVDSPELLKRKKENAINAFDQEFDGEKVYSEMIDFLENTFINSNSY